VWWFTDVSEVLATFIVRAMIFPMMEAARASETSLNFYQTTRTPSRKTASFILAT
jgi:hypothetical protein